jgi:hypothetical protein
MVEPGGRRVPAYAEVQQKTDRQIPVFVTCPRS